jgi:hypothetical protein
MIPRQLTSTLLKRLQQSPAVALLGSRQVGKTTLARELDLGKPSHYIDLERPSDLAKFADPELYLSGLGAQLVILDEVQRVPDLFPVLRSLIDERRRAGERAGHFLLLGSASPELLQQSSETLAGRISYLELSPLQLLELPDPDKPLQAHWERGGYPDSYLAPDEDSSIQWREDFITSYVERYLPQQGITTAPILLRRFCTMLAHQQGATINLSKLAGSLGIDGKTCISFVRSHRGRVTPVSDWSNHRRFIGGTAEFSIPSPDYTIWNRCSGIRSAALPGRAIVSSKFWGVSQRARPPAITAPTQARRWISPSRKPTAKFSRWKSSARFRLN